MVLCAISAANLRHILAKKGISGHFNVTVLQTMCIPATCNGCTGADLFRVEKRKGPGKALQMEKDGREERTAMQFCRRYAFQRHAMGALVQICFGLKSVKAQGRRCGWEGKVEKRGQPCSFADDVHSCGLLWVHWCRSVSGGKAEKPREGAADGKGR
jgi:hypothetical protein